jgi:ABC-type transporter Mla subunit MlaD
MSKADRLTTITEVYGGFDPADAQEAVTALAEALDEANDHLEEATQAIDEAVSAHDEREWDTRNEAVVNAVDANENLIESMANLEGLLDAAIEKVRAFMADAAEKPEAVRDHLDRLDVA